MLPLHIRMGTCDTLFIVAHAANPLVAFMHRPPVLFFISFCLFSVSTRSEHYTVSLLGKARGHMKGFLSIYFRAFCVTTKVRKGRIQMLRDEHQLSGLRALAGLRLYSKEGIRYI